MKNKPLIRVENLYKSYINKNEKVNVLNNITFDVFEGEFVSIVGTSGCGKTTLLNIIAQLDKQSSGSVTYNLLDKKSIGYMFQDSALFPWLTIEKNSLLGCEIKNIVNKDYVYELLKKYDILDFKDKYPSNLSGGMKQRVALIRTISTKPKLLLLDEPFAALDYQSRLSISKDVYELVKENNITTIMITHDISEAISLSDKVIVLSKRPSVIKNIYEIKLENQNNPIKRRNDINFSSYYEKIGRDLDIFET